MTEQLSLDLIDETTQDPLPELYDNLKSPDRTKSWKNSKLRRKTHSGSPNEIAGNENVFGNRADMISEKPVPLSPVNQRKWKKSEMKRRSTVTARKVKLNNSVNEKSSLCLIGLDCFAISSTKVEVRHSSDISEKALRHKFTCSCMQYLDESTGIVYKLQDHESFDRNILRENCRTRDYSIDHHIINPPIKEEDPLKMGRTSPPPISDDRIQTFAENTKAENIAEVFDFNTDFKLLDDTVVELQAIQGDLREVNLREVWSDSHNGSCCDQKSVEKRRIPISVLESMSGSDSSSLVYLLISVFSYLDLSSVFQAGRVCRTWRCATQHPAVWRNVTVKCKTLTPHLLHSLADTCNPTQQFTISNCIMEDTPSLRTELKNLYNSMTASLKALYLHSNSDTNLLLEEAITHCTNLTRLSVGAKMLDSHLDSISNNLKQLTCLNIGNTRGINPHQFYELESVKCLAFNASGLRVDEIGCVVEWFPRIYNLHIVKGASIHSYHVKKVFGSAEYLLNVKFTDTYVTPRALLFLLCTFKELKVLSVSYSFTYTSNHNFEDRYRSAIQSILNNPLFDKVLKISFEGPKKPPRTPPVPEEDS